MRRFLLSAKTALSAAVLLAASAEAGPAFHAEQLYSDAFQVNPSLDEVPGSLEASPAIAADLDAQRSPASLSSSPSSPAASPKPKKRSKSRVD